MFIEQTISPSSQDIDFLTAKINESAKALGVNEEACPFAFFMHDDQSLIIAGCNGSVMRSGYVDGASCLFLRKTL